MPPVSIVRWHEFGYCTFWGLADPESIHRGFSRWMCGHVYTFLRRDVRPWWML